MAFDFSEIRKNNPYHDPKTGRFTTASGGAVKTTDGSGTAQSGSENSSDNSNFIPVDLNADWDHKGTLGDYVSKMSGDLVTVGGIEYRDIGSDGYYDYIRDYGETSSHDLSEGTGRACESVEDDYVGKSKSFRINRTLRHDQDTDEYEDTISALDKAIASDKIRKSMVLSRYVGMEGIAGISTDVKQAIESGAEESEIVDLINKQVGQIATEKGYMSASMTADLNYFKGMRPVRLALLTPEGTPAYITENDTESEVVLGRKTEMRLVGAQLIEADFNRQIQVIYQLLPEIVEKSAIRTPEMLTVEPVEDTEKIIRMMMGIEDEEEDIRKYNHNHGKDGKFVSGDGSSTVSVDSGTVPKTLGKEYRVQAEEAIKEIIDPILSKSEQTQLANDLTRLWNSKESAVAMRVSPETMDQIVSDGLFKNQLETGKSSGFYVPELRKEVSEELFGKPDGKMLASDYEKYGYFGSSDFKKDTQSQAAVYGSATVHFKKESLDGRTTYTCRDSIRGMKSAGIIGSKESSVAGFADAVGTKSFLDRAILKGQIDRIHSVNDPSDIHSGMPYIELQLHGKLSLSDVESVCFDTGDFPKRSTVQKLMDQGIKVYKRTTKHVVSEVDDKYLSRIKKSQEEDIKKYNHNHDANGRFCSAGAGVVVDPTGSASRKQIVSKLTGQAMRDYSKEVANSVIQANDIKEARKRTQESFKAFTEASDAAHEALHARKPKPRSEWDSEDELRDLMGIQPMTGEKEWREAYERENAAREQWQKDAAEMKKLMVDAQGGAKTNADFDAPKPAERSEYPGFKDSTGVSYYDDKDNLRYHGLKSSVVEMTPTEYLERCAANFNSAKEDASDRTATLAGQVMQLNSKNVEKLQLMMENGTKMDMPYLNVGSDDGAQEGRHRAMAAYNLGMEKIPVLYVESTGISKSAEEVEFLKYHFAKHNEYHDEKGRFTFAPGGTHRSDNDVSRETHESASAWSDYIKSEQNKLNGEKQSEKALYAYEHNIASMDDCIAAMKEGKADELLDRYFEILEQNGDYRPTKETGGQIRIDKEASENGWTAARRDAIQNATGCDGETAETYRKSLETYFGGASITAEDTGIIDDYVSKAPAFNDTMYRGIAWGAGDGGYDDFIKNVQQGSEIDMRGQVSSWSSNEEVARGFAHHGDNNADSVMFVCVGNRTATPVNHLSMMGESEVLAGSDTKWTVLHTESAEWSSGARKTWVYVIEKGEKE